MAEVSFYMQLSLLLLLLVFRGRVVELTTENACFNKNRSPCSTSRPDINWVCVKLYYIICSFLIPGE